jgi:hypothetical protein
VSRTRPHPWPRPVPGDFDVVFIFDTAADGYQNFLLGDVNITHFSFNDFQIAAAGSHVTGISGFVHHLNRLRICSHPAEMLPAEH